MASIIRVRRSTGITPPSSLNFGELALTVGVGTHTDKGGRLFAGDNSNNDQIVGGRYYTDLLSIKPGLVASQTNPTTAGNGFVAICDQNRKVDQWNVDNLRLDSNTLSSQDTDGDIIIDPNGSGDIMIPDDTKIGFGGGGAGTSAPDTAIEYDENATDRMQVTGTPWTFNNALESDDKDTGSAVFEGGVGIEKNLNVGGNLTVTGIATFRKGVYMTGPLWVDNVGISSNVISTKTGGGNKLYIDPYPDGLSNEGQVIIKGDLQVDGTTTTVNSSTVTSNENIFKLGDVTSVRTVKANVAVGATGIVLDSIVGVNTGDVITGSSNLPGAGTTTVSGYASAAGISTVYITGVTHTGTISTTTEMTITHAYDTNTDRGISYNYNTSSGVTNNKVGFFGYIDGDTNTASSAPARAWTYIPEATVSNSKVTGARGFLDVQGIYYQDAATATHGVVYFTSAGLQTGTPAPAAFTAADTSTHILTAITESVIVFPSGQSFAIGDQVTQVGTDGYGVVKATISSATSLTLVGVNGTFNNSGDIKKNGTSISVSPNSVTATYTDKPVWTNTLDGGSW